MLIKVVGRDIKIGTIQCLYKYIFAIVVVFVCVQYYSVLVELNKEAGIINGDSSIVNMVMIVFMGEMATEHDITTPFTLHIYWLCVQVGIHYIIAYHTENDWSKNAKLLTYKVKRRLNIWLGKCIWCVFSVILYYLILIVSATVIAYIKGYKMSLNFNNNTTAVMISRNCTVLTFKEMLLASAGICVLVTIALCLFQIACSLFLSSVLSFAIICSLYVASAYYQNPFLPGNYTMFIRSSVITYGGVSPISGLVLSVFLIMISFWIGKIYIEESDVLK